MIIDGAFIKYLAIELNKELEKSRLEKVLQVSDTSFVLQFYFKGKKRKCVIDLSPSTFSTYISNKDYKAITSSQFLLTLKKQLEGGILESITQYLSDRVLMFNFTVYDFIDGPVKKMLVFEAMGKHSNLLLVKEDILIDTHKKMFFDSGRQLIPGAAFEFFPTDKKMFDFIDYSIIDDPKMLSNTYMGVSFKLASYLFEHKLQISDLVVNPTKDLKTNKGYFTDIFPKDHKKQNYKNLSCLLGDRIIVDKQFKQSYELFINRYLKKLYKKTDHLDNSLEKSTRKIKDKERADLIYQSGLDLNSKQSTLEINDVSILLDVNFTLNQNAQKLYQSYHKAKRGLQHVSEQITENKQMIDLFESLNVYLEIAEKHDILDIEKELITFGYKAKKQTITKKTKNNPNIITISDDNATYLIGKNNIQNEYVTHQLARPTDYFFHVKDAPGSHLIVRTDTLNEVVLRKASMLAAYFSSQKHSSSIPVDYTLVKHIKKIPKVPGYKVIIKNQKTMYIDIDEKLIESYLK